jgi:NADH dehydrogenase FAD-containing subunit
MAEQGNIVVLGGSYAGILVVHYLLKHILPALKARDGAKYHVYLVEPSTDYYFRVGSPRTAASASRLPIDKLFYPIKDALKNYSKNDVTHIQAKATSLDTTTRSVGITRVGSQTEEPLTYHALVISTGTRTFHPAFSSTNAEATREELKSLNSEVNAAHDIVVSGGGPAGVEFAAEVGEHLNGKPGWFSTPVPKANITLITNGQHLLPQLRPAIGDQAEHKLKKLGVKVVYGTSVISSTPTSSGKTEITLSKGDRLETDLHVAAHGVRPNSEFLPRNLVTEKGYVKTNAQTLRVDDAGPRVYAFGDIGSYSRNHAQDITDALPALMINLKRDLFSFNPKNPSAKPAGKDRIFAPNLKETQLVPVGSAGGVGAIFGWKLPNWAVWMIKSRDYLTGMVPPKVVEGSELKKEFKWSNEEAVV